MPRKPTFHQSFHTNASAEMAWQLFAVEFGQIKQFSSTIRNSWLSGTQAEGIGVKRRCEFSHNHGFIEERITGWNINRELQWEIRASSLPFRGVEITLVFEPSASGCTISCDAVRPAGIQFNGFIVAGKLRNWMRNFVKDAQTELEQRGSSVQATNASS